MLWNWREREEVGPDLQWEGTVCFLGTGGNPEAVSGQYPHTAGFVITIDGVQLYIDPGPGAVVRANELGLDLGRLDGIYISHGHIDHYEGAESIIEAMCWAMSSRRGLLMTTQQVLQEELLISEYHQGEKVRTGYVGGPDIHVLKEYEPIKIKDLTITPIPAYHGGENYGFVIEGRNCKIGYTSDTNYIRSYLTSEGVKEMGKVGPLMDFQGIVDFRKDIKEAYQDVDILIANITTHNSWAHRHITTLGLPHLLEGSKVKACLLTHFNYSCVEPVDLRDAMAEYVEMNCGIKCIAAKDDDIFNFLDLIL
jgi:ribonuclease BN (tRNA processing enzyme)